MSVINMMVGATTDDGATFSVKVNNGPVRIAVADNSGMSNPTFFGPESTDANDAAKVVATGLEPSTRYWWQVEDDGDLDTSITGQFFTHPPQGNASSFSFAVAGDAGLRPTAPGATGTELLPDRISNSPIFELIRKRALEEDWLFFAHLGDLHYYNLGDNGLAPGTLANYRRAYDDVLLQPLQGRLYRDVSFFSIWDDHDFGENNSDSTLSGKENAQQAYRERIPHYPLGNAGGPIYQSFEVGRVLFIGSDSRSDRTPNETPDVAPGLVLNGLGWASTPHKQELSTFGDLDLRADFSPASTTPATEETLVSKYEDSTNNREYRLALLPNGTIRFRWSEDGAGLISADSTVAPTFNGGRAVIRGVLLTNEADTWKVIFYNGDSINGPWTQFDEVTGSPGTSVFQGNADLLVGARDDGDRATMNGVIHAVQVRRGDDGPIVANPIFNEEEDEPFEDDNENTWVLNGTAQLVAGSSAKTMLGQDQKDWIQNELANTDAELLIWFMPLVWMTGKPGGDSWGSFATERDEIVSFLDSLGWLDRMVMFCGDYHGLAIESGKTNKFGGFPVMICTSLDCTGSSKLDDDIFDVLPSTPGRNQYAEVDVIDLGHTMIVRMTAWHNETNVKSYQVAFPLITTSPNVATSSRIASGSNVLKFEARVLTEFQTTDDPDGVEIEIEDGNVEFDATSEIFSNLELTTPGVDEKGNNLFPRQADDLLAPYGNEIFVRAGIDIGSGVVWSPMGYFRIDSVSQPEGSDGLIQISASDRMSTIIDSELLEPRQFKAGTSFSSIINDLIGDIYPDAVFQIVNTTGDLVNIERELIVESSRHQALFDVAESLGKVIYWGGIGDLRVEEVSDLDDIVWEIKAGRNGVLVQSDREVSRENMANAVVAHGEGSSGDPARAVVIDDNPNSPTRWGGRFGKIPFEYSSPLLTDPFQTVKAARKQLERLIGMTYSANFQAVTNPSLRPRQMVRITQKDGNREKHRVQSLSIPLVSDQDMSGTTVNQTVMRITEL